MINPGSILSLLFLHLSFVGISQSDTINRIDANGFKQGYWIVYGGYVPEKGYCDTCKVEEGPYLEGRKTGEWKFYHKNGVVRVIGNFQYGRPVGVYTKIDTNGTVIETGTFANGKQQGSFKSYYPSGCLAVEKTYNENGKEENRTIFYYDNCDMTKGTGLIGSVEKKFQKANGVTFGTAVYYYPDGCLKELIYYGEDGFIINSDVFEDDCPDSLRNNLTLHAEPFGKQTSCEPGVKITPEDEFDADGVNKLYDKEGNLWMEGQFKDGKLWNGKVYSYDQDGILTKVEVWKNGLH